HLAAGRVQHVDLLAAADLVPVQEVEGHLVRGPVGEVDVHREGARGVPRGRDVVAGGGRLLQGAGVGGGGHPGVLGVARRRDGGVAGVGGRAGADDVGAVAAV